MSEFLAKFKRYTEMSQISETELVRVFVETMKKNTNGMNDDLWEILLNQSEENKFLFIEIMLWNRLSEENELECWWSIDLSSYPVFGLIYNYIKKPKLMSELAKNVVNFYNKKPEFQEEILKLLIGTREANDFYGETSDPESEAGIYAQILPEMVDPLDRIEEDEPEDED